MSILTEKTIEKKIVRFDQFPVENEQALEIFIENANSPYKQGLSLGIEGFFECGGRMWKKDKKISLIFWHNPRVALPLCIKVSAFTEKEFITIYNIWETPYSYLISDETGKPTKVQKSRIDSRIGNAGMLVEEIENGRRYYCNDGRLTTTFDSIIFSVKRTN
jgi:hypothetical protein